MIATLSSMGRTKKPAPASPAAKLEPTTETVRIGKTLVRRITQVAIRRGVTVRELLEPLIAETVNQLYREYLQDAARELDTLDNP